MSNVIPAVLPESLEDLEEKIELFATLPHIQRVQIDIVDGQFASPASWPYTEPGVLDGVGDHAAILPHADRLSYEIDLMCHDAARAAETWLSLGASHLTFHIESLLDPVRDLAHTQGRCGREIIMYGIALNIDTDTKRIEPLLDSVDYVQFMGIATIGKQGQPFDTRVLKKIREFRMQYPTMPVQVDGGVSQSTIGALAAIGVSDVIVGSAITRADHPAAVVEKLESTPISADA